MGAAGRAVEVAGGAPLHPYLDSFDLHVLVQRRAEVVVFILVFVCCSMQNWKLVETAEGKEKRADPVSTWDTGALQRADGLSPLPCLRQRVHLKINAQNKNQFVTDKDRLGRKNIILDPQDLCLFPPDRKSKKFTSI